MKQRLAILIIGGYGIFGGRLVTLLENEPRLSLIVAGRSSQKAERFCAVHSKAAAHLSPVRFDRTADVQEQLAAIKPDLVVDASGPFQSYGADRYKLIEACILLHMHYLDLADGSDFVAGIGKFDDAAKSANIFALSGVSSFPVLTACVVKELSKKFSTIHTIRGGIAPSPYAGVGENVIRAIAGYAGQPIKIRRDAREATAYPLTETLRYTIALPGRAPLTDTLFSLVDVPDLMLLLQNWPATQNIWMGAAPAPEILHRALIALAWLVRLRWLPTLAPLAKLMHFVTNHVRWGADRGGMFVEVAGHDATGNDTVRSWHLIAEGEAGPFIPCMAIEAIIRKILEGQVPPTGARAALNDLTLADYEKVFSGRAIYTGFGV